MLDSALKVIKDASSYLYEAAIKQYRETPVLVVNEDPPFRIRRLPVVYSHHLGRVSLAPLVRHLAEPKNERSIPALIQAWDEIAAAMVRHDDQTVFEVASEIHPHMVWSHSTRTEMAVRFLYVTGLQTGGFDFVDRGIRLRLNGHELGMNHLSLFLSSGRTRWVGKDESYHVMLAEQLGPAVPTTPLTTAIMKMAFHVAPSCDYQMQILASGMDLIGREATDAFLSVGWSLVDAFDQPITDDSSVWDKARHIVVNAIYDPTEELRELLAGVVSDRDLEIGLAGFGDSTSKYHGKRRTRHLEWIRTKASTQRRGKVVVDESSHANKRMLQLQEILR